MRRNALVISQRTDDDDGGIDVAGCCAVCQSQSLLTNSAVIGSRVSSQLTMSPGNFVKARARHHSGGLCMFRIKSRPLGLAFE